MVQASLVKIFLLVIGHYDFCDAAAEDLPPTFCYSHLEPWLTELLRSLQDPQLTIETKNKLGGALEHVNRDLFQEIEEWERDIERLKQLNQDRDTTIANQNKINQDLGMRFDSISTENERLRAQFRSITVKNQGLEQAVEAGKARITKLESEQREQEAVNEKEHSSAILQSNCIVGAITLLATALVLFCGFSSYYSHQKKQWEIQRLQKLLSVHNDYRKADEIIEAHRRVSEEIQREREGGVDLANAGREAYGNTAGARFNDLVVNSAAVQVVLMDDVLEDIKTEGDVDEDL